MATTEQTESIGRNRPSKRLRKEVEEFYGVGCIVHELERNENVIDLAHTLSLPRFDGHTLGLKKGLNNDSEEASRGNAPAV